MKLYTVKEVAGILRTNPTRVYKLIHGGLLPAIKLGQYKVHPDDLDRFLCDYRGMNISDLLNIQPIVN